MRVSIAHMVGVLVLLGGATRMVWAFQASSLGKGVLGFAIGLLTLICGVAFVTDPLLASGFLTIMLAAYFLVDGTFEVAAEFRLRPTLGGGWLLLGGLLSFVFGVMIWQQFPLSGSWSIGILLGVKLPFVEIIMIDIGSSARKYAFSWIPLRHIQAT